MSVQDHSAFEAIYFPGPVPADNSAMLTVLGVIFDRVYFPGVYFPKSGFDQAEVDKEIARIEALPGAATNRDDADLVGMLRFLRVAKAVEGLCIFSGVGDGTFRHAQPNPEWMEENIYEAYWGPTKTQLDPDIRRLALKGHFKRRAHPYPADTTTLPEPCRELAKTGIPLLTVADVPIPGGLPQAPTDNAKVLSAILAFECLRLALPEFPLLTPTALMDFRAENIAAFANFPALHAVNRPGFAGGRFV